VIILPLTDHVSRHLQTVIQDTLTIHGVEHGIDVRSSCKLAILALAERRWTTEMLLARFVLGFRAGFTIVREMKARNRRK
jgi:hypothetical protein